MLEIYNNEATTEKKGSISIHFEIIWVLLICQLVVKNKNKILKMTTGSETQIEKENKFNLTTLFLLAFNF